MNDQGRNPQAPAFDTAAIAEMTQLIIIQIKQLAELRETGALTEEEFTAKKSELLARL
jgi:hypothetical protein